jgi:hypothetical protein
MKEWTDTWRAIHQLTLCGWKAAPGREELESPDIPYNLFVTHVQQGTLNFVVAARYAKKKNNR